MTSTGGKVAVKNFQSVTTNRKIAFHVLLFKNFTDFPPPPPPVLLEMTVRAMETSRSSFQYVLL